MGVHLINSQFQSDKYPTTPRGKVPLSVKDTTAQDLLWEYAQRRRPVDAEFSDDLEEALKFAGFTPPRTRMMQAVEVPLCTCGAAVVCAGLNGPLPHKPDCAVVQQFFTQFPAAGTRAAMTIDTDGLVWGYGDNPNADHWWGAFATREEAIAAGKKNYTEPFAIKAGRYPDVSGVFADQADMIIENAEENASEFVCSEEEWLSLPPHAVMSLAKVLRAWAKENVRASAWDSVDGTAEAVEWRPEVPA